MATKRLTLPNCYSIRDYKLGRFDMQKEDFYNYVLDFYNGETGIYKDVDATLAEVVDATRKLEKMYRSNGEEPVYDSIDRERVRDFILESRN